jgi:hypothetical protein
MVVNESRNGVTKMSGRALLWRFFGRTRGDGGSFPVVPHDAPPGPLASVKAEPGGRPGKCSPVCDEVESAHLLANEARQMLHDRGLSDAEILACADDFVAEDRGSDLEDFVDWAVFVHERSRRQAQPSGAGAR